MAVPYVLLHIVVAFMFICSSIAETRRYRIAKSDCPEKCGDVLIPYPFGFGRPICYLNPNFQVICDKTSDGKYKPFFKKTGMEILEVSLGGSVRVNNRVVSSDCNRTESSTKIDISASSFSYDQLNNKFTVVGCDSYATFIDGNDSTIGGCFSVCRNSEISGCHGFGCCQTYIPPSLKFFKINMSNHLMNNHNASNCRAAFMVENSWFLTNGSSYRLDDLKKMEYIPAQLEWGSGSSGIPCDPEIYFCAKETCWGDIDRDSFCVCNAYYGGSPIKESCNDSEWKNCATLDNTFAGCSRLCVKGLNYDECLSKSEKDYIKKFVKGPPIKYILIGCGSGLGVLSLLIATWSLCKKMKQRKAMMLKQQFFKRNGGLLLQQQLSSSETNIKPTKIFNSVELEKATDNFHANRVLGDGGQGTVYKGMLIDGRVVAIKKSKVIDNEKLAQFINEIVILSQINHRNVVKLLGCCLETEVPLLVYEFVPNGTLSDHIHQPNEDFLFTWEMRLRIAIEIACALSYMHSSASMPIYHRDIKSSNILLDDKYRAKVSDFGTSKSVSVDVTHATTRVQGTFGYLDPEYFRSSQFTEKSDVYSFGVVLVELLTGRKPICLTESDGAISLVSSFLGLKEENSLFEIIDERIVKEASKDEIVAVSCIAKRCLSMEGKKRPTMLTIAMELEEIKTSREAVTTIDVKNDYEEVEYSHEEETEIQPWNRTSFSTESRFSYLRTPVEVDPLLYTTQISCRSQLYS